VNAEPDPQPTAEAARRAEIDPVTLARARRGDRRAMHAVIVRYQRMVYALLGRMLGPGDVDDIAQETFLRVCRALPRFEPGPRARLSTWILTIATRRAIDELRRRARPTVLMADPPQREDGGPDPERLAAGGDLRAALLRGIDALTVEQRGALVLRAFHDLSYAEIAEALAISPGTVKSRISRARAALHRALEVAR